jgi:hypothetical protein
MTFDPTDSGRMVGHSSQARVPACGRDRSERYGRVPRNPGHHSWSQIEAAALETTPFMSVRGEECSLRESGSQVGVPKM